MSCSSIVMGSRVVPRKQFRPAGRIFYLIMQFNNQIPTPLTPSRRGEGPNVRPRRSSAKDLTRRNCFTHLPLSGASQGPKITPRRSSAKDLTRRDRSTHLPLSGASQGPNKSPRCTSAKDLRRRDVSHPPTPLPGGGRTKKTLSPFSSKGYDKGEDVQTPSSPFFWGRRGG
jgi:hypothetical protein